MNATLRLLFIPFFLCNIVAGQETTGTMQPIKSEKDLAKFAYCMIAYSGGQGYFTGGSNPINQEPIGYGFINKGYYAWDYKNSSPALAFELKRLNGKKEVHHSKAFLPELFKNAELMLRLITPEEKNAITLALVNKTAEFDYVSDLKEALAMLQGKAALEKYWQQMRNR